MDRMRSYERQQRKEVERSGRKKVYYPRKLARGVARVKMKKAGIQKANKHFEDWRGYVMK